MKRFTAALALLALSGTLLFPSAAAPFSLGQSDAITQDVALAPADSANGDYAYLDENDELVVDLSDSNPNLADTEGINADGVTHVDDVLTVRYNGSRYAHVWLTHESDDVTFYADGHPIQSEANNVTLAPNQSLAVGIRVDTRGETTDGIIDDVTVHARVAEPEDVDDEPVDVGGSSGGPAVALRTPSAIARSVTVVGAPSDAPTTIDLDAMSTCRDGDGLTLDAVTVVREGTGTLDLQFRAVRPPTDVARHTESLCAVRAREASSGDTVTRATFRFSVDRDTLAEWNVSPDELVLFRTDDGATSTLSTRVVDRSDETVRFAVDSPGFSRFTVAAARPDVEVTAARLGQTELTPRQAVTVIGRIENDGRTTETRSVVVTLNETPVATRSVTLEPGETTRVTVSVRPQTPGQYDVRIENRTAGTVTVVADPDGDSSSARRADPPSNASTWRPTGLGIGEVIALSGVLAVTVVGLVGIRRWVR
jgi:hypothetical protein